MDHELNLGDDISVSLLKKPPTHEDAVAAVQEITRLRKHVEELQRQLRDIRVYYHSFHNDALNYMLKKDIVSGFLKYRKKRKREIGVFEEE